MTTHRWLRASALLLGVAGLAGAAPAPSTPAGDRLTPERIGLARTKSPARHARLDTGLNEVLSAADPLAAARDRHFAVRGSRVQVWVEAEAEAVPALVDWLGERGATFVVTAGVLVQAFVTPDVLLELDGHPDVAAVRRPIYVEPASPAPRPVPVPGAGTVETEALGAMNVPAWHAAGKKGQGLKVGVVDSGFANYQMTVANGELPAGKTFFQAINGADVSGSPHGTACAEIVYDAAPQVDALFLVGVGTMVDVGTALTNLRNEGVKVVSMSLGIPAGLGPGDGTGLLKGAVDSFTNAGGLVFISAGNSGQSHWQGSFLDADGDSLVEFNAGGAEANWFTTDGTAIANVAAGTSINAYLVWNQWSSPQTDLDLYLYYSPTGSTADASIVARSEDLQNGQPGQTPTEFIGFTTTAAGGYFLVAKRAGGPTANLDIEMVFRPDIPLRYQVRSGSLAHPGDVASAVTIAAVDVTPPYALEAYSSAGPTNGPGGSLAGGSIKPDLSGFANVSTMSYGPRAFNGTSSACPHVAGAGALLWAANPAWSGSQVRSALEQGASDMGPGGKDNDYGWGRVVLGSPGGGGGGTTCSADSETLCLYAGRFKVQATFRDYAGNTGNAKAVSLTSDSGYFWFFSSTNVELVAKIVSFCNGSSGNYGLYASGLTDVQVTFKVTDTKDGTYREYTNPLGNRFCTIGDGPFSCP